MLANFLRAKLNDNGLLLNNTKIELLLGYLTLLNQWNTKINLTAIKDPKQQVVKHIIDSLSISHDIGASITTILDVGSGAGLPGIPLGIFFPEKQFLLIDASLKRVHFLQHVLRRLQLTNIHALHQRVEQVQLNQLPKQFQAGFSMITSRAFTGIAPFIAQAKHLLARDGYFLAMKGCYPNDEIAEIPKDFCVTNVRELSIIGLTGQRHVLRIEPVMPQ